MKLAGSHRAGDLTPVWVPDAAQAALRDLTWIKELEKRYSLGLTLTAAYTWSNYFSDAPNIDASA